MCQKVPILIIFLAFFLSCATTQKKNMIPSGYKLVWADEFKDGTRPNTKFWSYEKGFVRNEELQWYQPENAKIQNGKLVISGKKNRLKITNISQKVRIGN